ncbi:MAG TPA: family 78 glycoside hydrolase catalytic domain [Tepidisphaeraceae bacterium]|nr:family 78 glycoside hydrolase catalytic domain [Tepidisphaeraceae bacterium]
MLSEAKHLAVFVVAAFALSVMASEPVKLEVTNVAPVRFEQHGETYFADFGQDAYGNLQITLPKDTPTATLTVRLGEKLSTDGTIDRKPPGSISYREVKLVTRADQSVYKLDISTKERHKNPAAVHMPVEIGEVAPFRYIEIEGSPAPLDKSSVKQLFVHAPFDDNASSFECSDETLNAVWNLCKHTMKATTAFGIYIDGERERIPYEADAYINLLSHYACDLDPQVGRVTFEHLLAHPTWPTEWSLHMPMIAAADYEATGEIALTVRNDDALKKKLLMEKARADGLLRAPGVIDWPAAERDGYNDGVVDPKHKQQIGPEINTVVNAFYYHALQRMATLARAAKKDDDAREFYAKAKQVYESFNAKLFDASRGIYLDGEGAAHASLHANMFPLAFGLVPKDRQARVADFVQSRGMACSVYGAQYLLEGLFLAGRDDYAISLMTSKGERSWWHMIDLGSTMTLEAWDAKYKPNLTWNHAWGAAPANIISRYVLGVRPLEPGYKKILIAPRIGSLKFARGKVPTPFGPVTVSVEGARLSIEVPKGATATVELDDKSSPETVGPGPHVFTSK